MKVDQIRTADDVERYIEGCLNDFEEGISEKDETVVNLAELVAHVYKKATGKPCVEDIPVRKFQDGDKVVLKSGCENIQSGVSYYCSMDEWIGKPITVSGINSDDDIYGFYDCPWNFAEDWLEPYVEELKEGDLAIFWDEDKKYATIRIYDRSNESAGYIRHKDHKGSVWANAIKFESKEQYRKLLRGEI